MTAFNFEIKKNVLLRLKEITENAITQLTTEDWYDKHIIRGTLTIKG